MNRPSYKPEEVVRLKTMNQIMNSFFDVKRKHLITDAFDLDVYLTTSIKNNLGHNIMLSDSYEFSSMSGRYYYYAYGVTGKIHDWMIYDKEE